jgi:DNA-directed RNA polymerase specialized sigma24 family protein
LTHGEVARCLGMTVGTSKSQLFKAHKALRGVIARPRSPNYGRDRETPLP